MGFEPTHNGFADRRLNHLATRLTSKILPGCPRSPTLQYRSPKAPAATPSGAAHLVDTGRFELHHSRCKRDAFPVMLPAHVKLWYAMRDLNPRLPTCKEGTLATELIAHLYRKTKRTLFWERPRNLSRIWLSRLGPPRTWYLPPPRRRLPYLHTRRLRIRRRALPSWCRGSSCL